MTRERTSIGCAAAALAALGGALASLVRGYGHAVDTACPNNAPAPIAFWPLLIGAVVLAVVAFVLRPTRKNEHGVRGGTALTIFVVIAIPLGALCTVFAYWVTYGCWE